ncbi:hypothetical protein [Streptomyces sp. NPDC047981]|uniref:hypothetical protein n=1 Tax=Streptomyces sp. NPDC047981 TaxID=3154610 RepID=UPI0034149154
MFWNVEPLKAHAEGFVRGLQRFRRGPEEVDAEEMTRLAEEMAHLIMEQPWMANINEATRDYIYRNLLTGDNFEECVRQIVCAISYSGDFGHLWELNARKLKELPVGGTAYFIVFRAPKGLQIAFGDREDVGYFDTSCLAIGSIKKMGHGINPLPGFLPGRSFHGEYVLECTPPEYGDNVREYVSVFSKKYIR